MMLLKFKLIMYYDSSYTSPFLVKIGSLVMCFHPIISCKLVMLHLTHVQLLIL
jgi:hypothetical protein